MDCKRIYSRVMVKQWLNNFNLTFRPRQEDARVAFGQNPTTYIRKDVSQQRSFSAHPTAHLFVHVVSWFSPLVVLNLEEEEEEEASSCSCVDPN